MDAYDWDKTVYAKDSTADFFAYCLRRFPKAALPALPVSLLIALRHLQHTRPIPRHKQRFYRYYSRIPNLEAVVAEYWVEHQDLIGRPAMPTDPQPGDLIISAGAEFLLKDVCEARGFKLIATKIDPATGDMLSPDCFDHQKVARFREEYGADAVVDNWYSDSMTDDPMAQVAKQAHLVKAGQLLPWPGKEQ